MVDQVVTADYQASLQHLKAIGQERLLKYWDKLSSSQQRHILEQISAIDDRIFKQQQNLLKDSSQKKYSLEPFEAYSLSGNSSDFLQGKKMIAEGKMGCLIVAGGQGSRLRVEGPKGTCQITAIKNKSLFQLLAEKTLAAGNEAQHPLSLALMTSPLNHKATLDYFNCHHNFGLESAQLNFFPQKTLPLLDIEGNMFLENPYTIAEGPDGNGGALHCFYHSGLWQKWYRKGIRYLNFILIDNPLADPFDAELLGCQFRLNSDVIIKCIKRTDGSEKVGVLAKEGGHTAVVEYTEISPADRTATRPDGTLKYNCANLSLFCFTMNFIKKIATTDTGSLPLHPSFKAVTYLDDKGKVVKAENPMAWKFEKFIFDVIPHAKQVDALLYPREQCFAPLKNYSGPDSLDTVRKAVEESDRQRLSAITGLPCQTSPLEISQAFYYPTEDLKRTWHGKASSKNYVE